MWGINLETVIKTFSSNFGTIGFWSLFKFILDISVVSYVVYRIALLVRQTRAWQLMKGIILILFFVKISELLGLVTIAYMLNMAIQYIAIALIVLFQPELRRGLEQIGTSKFSQLFMFFEVDNDVIKTSAVIEEIIKAVLKLSKTSTGALIIIEKDTKIGEVINTGIEMNSNLSSELIINIFYPKAPLHDGALVVRDNKIAAAACFLPLTDDLKLNKDLGTRHRAALGISEISDCLSLIVSEETGIISSAQNGGLTRNLNVDTLRKLLNKTLINTNKSNKKIKLWMSKSKDDKTK